MLSVDTYVVTLSPRQKACLTLSAADLTVAQIGRRLGIASSTVETHLDRARRKLKTETRIKTILMAVKIGALDLDELLGVQ